MDDVLTFAVGDRKPSRVQRTVEKTAARIGYGIVWEGFVSESTPVTHVRCRITELPATWVRVYQGGLPGTGTR